MGMRKYGTADDQGVTGVEDTGTAEILRVEAASVSWTGEDEAVLLREAEA